MAYFMEYIAYLFVIDLCIYNGSKRILTKPFFIPFYHILA